MNGILIVAHAPLASALRQCALHVFPDASSAIAALDVQPNASPEDTAAQARTLLAQLGTPQALVLSDIFGATPCNVASRVVDGLHTRLIAGVNLPMLLRVLSYRHESLDALAARAMSGATQGVIPVAITAPQNQTRRAVHDPNHRDHQQ